MSITVRGDHQEDSGASRRSTPSISTSRAAGSSRCSGRRVRARRRCCASSPAWSSPTRASVQFDGEDISDRSARERRVGFVFQHYALFRHMTVFENVAFGLRVRPRAMRPSREAHSRARSANCSI